MKILVGEQFKELDRYTIENEPITSIDLMERAAMRITDAITKQFSHTEYRVKVFAGPGGNGGDALAVARMLSEQGYAVEAFLFNIKDKLSDDCQTNKHRLERTNVRLKEIKQQFAPPRLETNDLVIDGLFGTGLKEPLKNGFAGVVDYINRSSGTVISIDVPSGMMCEECNEESLQHAVKADITLSLQTQKMSFLMPEAEPYIGKVQTLDIGLSREGLAQMACTHFLTEESEVARFISERPRQAHKGCFGSAMLICGKYGMAGAAVLAAKACLRSGVGKVYAAVPERCNDILQISIPEAIVMHSGETAFSHAIQTDGMTAVAIGPGLGTDERSAKALHEQIASTNIPMVIDADALNIIARNKEWLSELPKRSILTPHPGEFKRLFGPTSSRSEAIRTASQKAREYGVYIVLKGANSAVACPDGTLHINPTGNEGMATAGSGDVLTGIITGLLASGVTPKEAAILGTYIHGLAGNIAKEALSSQSLIASDIINYLPNAFNILNEERIRQ